MARTSAGSDGAGASRIDGGVLDGARVRGISGRTIPCVADAKARNAPHAESRTGADDIGTASTAARSASASERSGTARERRRTAEQ
jgi:hypothetical protein